MKLIYDVNDKPKFRANLVFAFQQLLAILAATIAVPAIVGNGMSSSAALFGAGVGTLVYLLFTKFRSPVFLGSSFAFLGSMGTAFAGAVSAAGGGYRCSVDLDRSGGEVADGVSGERKTDDGNGGTDNDGGHDLIYPCNAAELDDDRDHDIYKTGERRADDESGISGSGCGCAGKGCCH